MLVLFCPKVPRKDEGQRKCGSATCPAPPASPSPPEIVFHSIASTNKTICGLAPEVIKGHGCFTSGLGQTSDFSIISLGVNPRSYFSPILFYVVPRGTDNNRI